MALSGAAPRIIIWVSCVLTLLTSACLFAQILSLKVWLSKVHGRESTLLIASSVSPWSVQPTPMPFWSSKAV